MILAAAETVLLGREMSCKLRRFLGCKPKKKRPADQLREQARMETRLLLTVTEMIAAIYEQVCEKTVEYRWAGFIAYDKRLRRVIIFTDPAAAAAGWINWVQE